VVDRIRRDRLVARLRGLEDSIELAGVLAADARRAVEAVASARGTKEQAS
jgi:hypothetical protein